MYAAAVEAGAGAITSLSENITIRRAPFTVRQAKKRIRRANRKLRRGRGRGPTKADLRIVNDYEAQVLQERLLAAQAQTQPSAPSMQQTPSLPGYGAQATSYGAPSYGAPSGAPAYGAPAGGGFNWGQAAMQAFSTGQQLFQQPQQPQPAANPYANPYAAYYNPAAYGAAQLSGHGAGHVGGYHVGAGHIGGYHVGGAHAADDMLEEVLDDAIATQIGDDWVDGYGEGQRERYQPLPPHVLAPLPEERQERIIALEKRIARLLENAPTPPHQRLLRKLIARHNVIRQRLGA